jgi:valyl-tRNA synthetase
MIAAWPEADARRVDATIEEQFARFQAVLGGLREIRARQNVPPKKEIQFSVRCAAHDADLLRPMATYFDRLAGAKATAWGANTAPPALSANFSLAGMEVFVDLADLIDVVAELAKKEKELAKFAEMIEAKKKKLGNEQFVQRAPQEVVEQEKMSLESLESQAASTASAIQALKRSAS